MNDLVVANIGRQLTVSELRSNVDLIRDVMKSVMVPDVHYGIIPGCGDKPALFQPGAQKLGLLFNLAPSYTIEVNALPNDHREYEVICTLTHRDSGRVITQGVGVCTTMESKYRFRWENTGDPVPPRYWDTRDSEIIGGPAFVPRKTGGKWVIFHRVEHDNPADYYNTVKKIAKKRAYNDAILTATAASDIFAPYDDTDPEFYPQNEEPPHHGPVEQPRSRSERKAKPESKDDGKPAEDKPMSESALKIIRAKLANAGLTDVDLEAEFGPVTKLRFSQFNDIQDWISKRAA